MQGAVQNSNIKRNVGLMIAAFAAVYIIWGSTYLAIRYAIETVPPFLMAATRFLVAGTILFTWARFSPDYERPKPEHWRTSLIVGTLLLLGGNGCVVFAERYISSSLTALLVAAEPFWVVILSWLWLRTSRPNIRVISGLAVGFIGVWLLISGQSTSEAVGGIGSMNTIGTVAVMVAALSWAAGSVYGLRAPAPRSAIQSAGMQMLAGGAVLLTASLVLGEWSQLDLSRVSSSSIYGLVYLLVFGSLLGFTAYSWLLKNANPATVATYAYVNPVIAVVLGWLIAGESMTGRMLIGAAVIVGSVVLITSRGESKGSGDRVEMRESIGPRASGKPISVSA